ncbi:MAG: hypothetical protein BGP13_08115 [Sphingobacteriales bacterium 40-81]|nr:MAG: hypothetical protein BGP13_08115 [Sphingobacteriales bacterium 40-81]
MEVTLSDNKRHVTFGLAIWRRDEYMLSFLFANRLQFRLTNLPAGRQVTPGSRINNELLVIYLAAVTGRRITEFRHIAKPYRWQQYK